MSFDKDAYAREVAEITMRHPLMLPQMFSRKTSLIEMYQATCDECDWKSDVTEMYSELEGWRKEHEATHE